MKFSTAVFFLALAPAHAGILDMMRGKRNLVSVEKADVMARGNRRNLQTSKTAQISKMTAIAKNTALVDTDKAEPSQTFYVPLPENDVYFDALKKIQPGRDQYGNPLVDGRMVSLVSVAISTDQTVIWYDHWEDGYEADVTNPASANTAIWGDGIASNGCRPDISLVKTCTDADDVLNAGDSFVVESMVPVPRDASNWFNATAGIKLDGGDKLLSSYPITVTRGEYAEKPGSLLAGAVEVYDTKTWGTEFEAPVGKNFVTDSEAFDYSRMFVMSASDNNEVTLPDGSKVTLNEGETKNFNVDVGSKVTSVAPLQAYLLTGDPGSRYEMRWFSLMPTSLWSNSYLAAVGDDFARTKVLMYNPGSSAITVKLTYLDKDGSELTENYSVNAKSAKYTRVIPTGSGGKLESAKNFFAISVTDSELAASYLTSSGSTATANYHGQAFDWGYPLQPCDSLTPQVLVGWGYGCTSNDCQGKTERSAVWVSPMEDANFYVDYENAGSGYDILPVKKFQSIMIRDTTDHDMSGAIIFATAKDDVNGPNGRPVDFASAWGQDASVSRDHQAISLDLGTSVLPFPTIRATKSVDKEKAAPGDILTYTVTVQNVGQTNVAPGDYKVTDPVHPMGSFVEGSVRFSADGGTTFTDLDLSNIDVGATPTPFDDAGLPSPVQLDRRGGTHQFTYEVKIDPDAVTGDDITAPGFVDPPYGDNIDITATTKLIFGPEVTVSNVVYLGDKGVTGCDSASESVTSIVGADVTYCFAVTNIGTTYLDSITLTNEDLGIAAGTLAVAKLGPGESKLVTFKSTIPSDDLENTVVVDANPVYNSGDDIEGVPNVGATDPSEVLKVDYSPEVLLENTVYAGHHGPNACEHRGVELVRGFADDAVTYCFKITNVGKSHLTSISLSDTDIGYTNSDIVDLAPGASTVLSMQSTLAASLENTATVTATPADVKGQPIPGLDDVTNSDPSQVIKVLQSDTKSGTKPTRPETCMQTNWEDAGNSQDLVCRAKEVYHVDWVEPPTLSCQEGEIIKLSLKAKVHYNTARYDSGWYVAQDGGDALRGVCTVNGLVNGDFDYKPEASKKGTNAVVSWNRDQKGGNDECGDLMIDGGGGADLVVPFIEEKEIKCVDENKDGLLDFGVCFSWRVKGKDGFCTLSRDTSGTQGLEADLFPATPSKCFCSRVDVGTISVIKPSDDVATSPC